ncbi:MAG TPA: DUF6614 family protein [Candidatus Thermoplasmatota archaeon]|nr:DUF6614 family protein [Candidatus Thermoplasmatota archaeon]
MDTYHIWVDLKNSHRDLEFAQAVDAYLGHLQKQGLLEGWRLQRRKLGLGPRELGEFHIAIETRDLAQLDAAFSAAAARAGETEKLHAAVYANVTNFRSALYRDFPDPVRVR